MHKPFVGQGEDGPLSDGPGNTPHGFAVGEAGTYPPPPLYKLRKSPKLIRSLHLL